MNAARLGQNWLRQHDNVKSTNRLTALVVALCVAAGLVRAQYVEDSIDVGGAWVGSLVYNSREDVVYGQSGSQGTLFAISCIDNSIVATTRLRGALVLAYDSVNNKAWCSYDGPGQESLAVIDGATHSVVKRIEMPGATIPVWDATSNRVYVSCQTTNSVAVLDAKTDSLLKYIPVGRCPIKMYINTLRRKLYVLNSDGGSISIVDMTTNQVIKTVVVGGFPNAGYYCRSADKFYSAGSHNQCVVIGGLSDTVVARIPLPGIEDILGATGNEDGGVVYLGTFTGQDDYVATVLAEKDSVVATAQAGAEVWGLTYPGGSGVLYCASSWSNEVYVLSGDGARVLRRLQVGGYPFVFAVVAPHRRLYLGHLGGRYVYVIKDTAEAAADARSPRPVLCGVRITPNPFTDWVTIVWDSPVEGGDIARVYAQDGRLVSQTQVPVGKGRWVWDGRDDRGLAVPPGVYVVETETRTRSKIVKLK